MLANRLSEDGKFTVLVLEAGGDDSKYGAAMQRPGGGADIMSRSEVTWQNLMQPQPVVGYGHQSRVFYFDDVFLHVHI